MLFLRRKYFLERLDVEREFSSTKHVEPIGNFSTVPVIVRSEDKNLSNIKINKDPHSNFSLYTTQLANQAHGDGHGINILEQEKIGSKLDFSSSKFRNSTENSKHQNLETNGNNNQNNIPREVTNKICDLVDRHWNGSKSLHENHKFIASICTIISNYNSNLKSTNENCSNPSNETKGNYSKYPAENNEFREMKQTNETLRNQIKELRQKLVISEKFSELTELLKQSHETLISTNEQLRKQLDFQDRRNQAKSEK